LRLLGTSKAAKNTSRNWVLGETNSQRRRKKQPSAQAWKSSSHGVKYTYVFGAAIVMKEMIEYKGIRELIFMILLKINVRQ
jgi:hypothetical protein